MAATKINEQRRARLLRRQGKSLNEIVSEIGVAKSSVSLWVRNVKISQKRHIELMSRGGRTTAAHWKEHWLKHPKSTKGPRWPKRESENFFDTWTPEMAYVLGYFAADGSMYQNRRGSRYVSFYSNDLQAIKIVRQLMAIKNRIERKVYSSMTSQGRVYNFAPRIAYTLQFGSKIAFERLKSLGFIPNKSLTLAFPKVPSDYLSDFVRGYFDGDGCVTSGMYRRKNRPSKTRVLTTEFTSGSKLFLEVLQARLRLEAKLSSGYLAYSGGAWRLRFGTINSRQLYNFMYPVETIPCLKRKRDKFEIGIELTK